MKKFIGLMLLASVILLSCKKSETAPQINLLANSTTVYGNFSLNLDGSGVPLTGDTYHFLIDTVYGQQYMLLTAGTNNGAYLINFSIKIPSTQPPLGEYSLDSNSFIQVMYDYNLSQPSYAFYTARPGYGKSSISSFNVISYDEATSIIYASFSCVLDDGFGNLHYVTNGTINGKFILKI